MQGRAFKFGDNISTDHIAPGRLFHLRSDLQEFAKHVLEDADENFAKEMRKGDFVVAGNNFGLGSSREHAALVPLYLGVKAVVAKSFARIHAANLINAGILPLTFENPEDYDKLEQDAKLTITGIVDGMKTGKLTVTADNGFTFTVNCDLTARQQAILLAGGLLNYTKEGGQ